MKPKPFHLYYARIQVFWKRNKTTSVNEITYMPCSGLPMLFDKEIQMQGEYNFKRFTSDEVIETFLADVSVEFFWILVKY